MIIIIGCSVLTESLIIKSAARKRALAPRPPSFTPLCMSICISFGSFFQKNNLKTDMVWYLRFLDKQLNKHYVGLMQGDSILMKPGHPIFLRRLCQGERFLSKKLLYYFYFFTIKTNKITDIRQSGEFRQSVTHPAVQRKTFLKSVIQDFSPFSYRTQNLSFFTNYIMIFDYKLEPS